MTEYKHIAPDFRKLMELSDQERIESLYEPFWIAYPQAKLLFQYLDSLLSRPALNRPQGALLMADSNMGKTTLIRQFAKLHPKSVVEDEDGITHPNIPVVVAEAPPSATERGLFTAVLDALGVSYRPSDTVAKLNHQMMHLLRTCGVKMLIIDEFHNLNAGTPAKLETIMNTIKSMSNILSLPIVAVGIDTAESIINRDPQIRSRFETLKLTKWKTGKEGVALLRQFEARLPLKKPSKFALVANQKKADHLILTANGNLGDLHKLLIECAKEAIITGEEEITFDIVKKFKGFRPTEKDKNRAWVREF